MQYPYKFNLDEWQSRISLTRLRQQSEFFDVGTIIGPTEAIVVEQHRAAMREVSDFGPSVPSDVFVFAAGEPECRYATKFGGLPYRSNSQPWPTFAQESELTIKQRDAERPLTFLFQLSFVGSTDIVGRVPGDLLLVFAEDLTFGRQDGLYFEWQSVNISDLVGPGDPATPSLNCEPAYGFLYRTADFPKASTTSFAEFRIDQHASIMDATKIGGVPMWIHDPVQVKGRFLATVCSLEPSSQMAYPLVNVERLDRTSAKRKTFKMGDAGHIHLFLSDDGSISWIFECF